MHPAVSLVNLFICLLQLRLRQGIDLAKNGFRIKVEVRFVIQRNDIAVLNGRKSLPDFAFGKSLKLLFGCFRIPK